MARIVFDIAESKNVQPAQIALAWLLHKGEDIVPIPGTKHQKYLEENLGAVSIKLDTMQMQALDEALTPEKISGQRYPDRIMATIDR